MPSTPEVQKKKLQRKTNRKRKVLLREQLNEDESLEIRELDRLQHQNQRINMSADESSEIRELDRQQHQNQRVNMSADVRQIQLERHQEEQRRYIFRERQRLRLVEYEYDDNSSTGDTQLPHDSGINSDARSYSEMFKGLSQFQCCARCGINDSVCKMVRISEINVEISQSALAHDYKEFLSSLSNPIDELYKSDLESVFVDGLIKGCKWMCKKPCASSLVCTSPTKKRKSMKEAAPNDEVDDDRNVGTVFEDGCDEEDSIDNDHADTSKASGKKAINGFLFYEGRVPTELSDLTTVETSMVSGMFLLSLHNSVL